MRQKRNQVVFLSGIAGLTAVLLWCAVYGIENKGKVNPSMNAALSSIVPETKVMRASRDERECPYRIGRVEAEPSMGLWGDSHAMALISALDAELKQRGVCCEVWVQPGNLPAMGVPIKGQDIVINDAAIAALSRPAIRQVIIAARWTSYLKGKPEDHHNSPRIVGAENPEDARRLMAVGLDKALGRLQDSERKTMLVYPVPETGIHVPYLMARAVRSGKSVNDLTLRRPAETYADRHDLTLAMFDGLCGKYDLLPVRPDRLMIRNGVLQISRGNLALYVDDDHLSRLGSEPLVREILARFNL